MCSPMWGRQLAGGDTVGPLLYLGRPQEVLDDLAEFAEATGRQRPWAEMTRLLCHVHLGQLAEARADFETVTEIYRLRDEDHSPRTAELVILMEAAVLMGDMDTTMSLMPKVASGVFLFTPEVLRTCISRQLGTAAALLGDDEQARDFYIQALDACEKVRFRPELALARLQLAELLLERYPSERASALEHLDLAIGEFREMKMQPSLERALKHKGLLHA